MLRSCVLLPVLAALCVLSPHARAVGQDAEPSPTEPTETQTPETRTPETQTPETPRSPSETSSSSPPSRAPSTAAEEPQAAEAPQPVPEPPGAEAPETGAAAAATAELGPKVAVVLAGDPDARLRQWAQHVERTLASAFEQPADAMLRGALRGGTGDPDDGLREVRRERRRLGLSEADDAPVLGRLGRRAGAAAVAVVRRGDDGPELVVLDVAHASFYEGALPLSDDTSEAQVRRFVGRRARTAARGTAVLPDLTVPPEATEPAPGDDEEEPNFFERYWPYGAAAVLLGVFVAVIAATASTDGGDQPVLRFVPGGR